MAKTASKTLSFDELLADTEVTYAFVDLGGDRRVRIGSITAEDWVDWTDVRDNPETKAVAGAMLINRSLVDDNGTRIGDEKKLESLKTMPLRNSETILRAIMKLNGLSGKAEAATKNV